MTRFVFLDFEANSLLPGTYPIEVDWGSPGVEIESHLIRPEPEWLDWSPESEAVHGITRQMLESDGRPAPWIARRLFETLTASGVVALADGLPHDQMWLSELLETVEMPYPRLRDLHYTYVHACGPLAREHQTDMGFRVAAHRIIMEAEVAIEQRGGRRHRAEAHVGRLIATYEEIVRVVQSRLQE